jgi:hypothetical protein
MRILFFTALESHSSRTRLFASHVGPTREFVTEYVRQRIAEARSDRSMPRARAFLG